MSSQTFNFINSVKGGCGKTTFSILLLSYFARLNEKYKEPRGLLFDIDLQGTALQYLVQGNTRKQDLKYLHDAIDDPNHKRASISQIEIGNFEWDIIFSSPDLEVKKLYRTFSEFGYFPAVQYSIFKDGIIRLLQLIRNKEDYKHLIFDMPPSSEGYAELVLKSVLNDMQRNGTSNGILKQDDKINLFFLTSLDAAQIMVTATEVYNFLANMEVVEDCHIFIVFNDIFDYQRIISVGDPFEDAYNHFISFFESKGLSMPEAVYNKIYFCTVSYNENYIRKCMDNEGLCEGYNGELAFDRVIPLNPMAKVFKYRDGYEKAIKVADGGEFCVKKLICHQDIIRA